MRTGIALTLAGRRIKRLLIVGVAAACAALGLASCSKSSGPQNTANTSASPTATQAESNREQSNTSRPFALGQRSFSSRQEFVENIRPRCATAEPPEPTRRSIRFRVNSLRSAKSEARAPGSVEIPVYFHVLTNNAGTEGNLSDEAIQRQIDILNVAYAGQGPGGAGAATAFKFKIAAIDRTANDAWFNMAYSPTPTAEERAAKAQLNKGGKSALNLYTARLADETLGWARWPWDIGEGVDGVVIRFSTLPGGDSSPYNEGDTATHEIGHWLGVFHTFQGGCETPNDEVDDTPAERNPTADCPSAKDSCPDIAGNDPVDNFMDYSDDSCMFKFTAGQALRMNDIYSLYRR
jgi:hypothetical protein